MTIRIHEPKSNSDTTSRGWVKVRFDALAENIVEHVEVPSESGYDRFVGGDHLDPGSLKITRWGSTDDVEAQKLLFKKGHILFGKRNAYLRKVAYADFDGVCSAHMLVLQAKPDYIIEEFLPFFMQTDQFWERALMISEGSMSPTIKWKILAQQEFVIPPKDEQRRIADILWAADETIEKYGEVIERVRATRNVLREVKFDNTKNNDIRLADLCEPKGIQIGPFGSQLHASDYVNDGIPVIMPSDIANDSVNEFSIARITSKTADRLSIHKVQPGDILLPRRGELNKRAFILPNQTGWICGTGSIRVRVRPSIIARAVFHALSATQTVKWIEDHAVGTTMPNLNAQIVSNIPISLPEKHELENVVQKLESLNDVISLQAKNIKTLKLLKKTLMDILLQKGG